MNIIVCMKVVPKAEQVKLDPETSTIDRNVETVINGPDKNALEMALQLKEKYGGTITVLSMGPPSFEEYLRLVMTMGIDDAVLLSDRALGGADALATSYTLAKGVEKIGNADLVLCGEESSDGATGQVPPGIASWLEWSQITYATELSLLEDGRLRGQRSVQGGHEIIASTLPAVVSVELGINSPRFPDFNRKPWADNEFKLTVWNAADIEADPNSIGLPGSLSLVSDMVNKEAPERKGQFINGTIDEKVQQLFEVIEPHL